MVQNAVISIIEFILAKTSIPSTSFTSRSQIGIVFDQSYSPHSIVQLAIVRSC